MKKGWANNGEPLDDGRYCYIIDLEDGSKPIKSYGRTREEALEKMANTAAHAEAMLPRLMTAPTPAAPAQRTPVARRTMTADEQLRATADLSVASKAPSAVVSLFEAETGLSVEEMQKQRFRSEAERWRLDHPEITEEIGRSAVGELLVIRAIQKAGGMKFAGYDHLEDAYQEMQAEGKFSSAWSNPQPSATQPDETPAPSGARPRGGVFSTTYRSTSVGNGSRAASQKRLKYTREQINNMPLEEYRRMIESGDAEFSAAVEFYSQPRQATA